MTQLDFSTGCGAGGALIAPPPLDTTASALFLDLDGTLAPFAATPAGVLPAPIRTQLLQSLVQRLSGAVAILSGRTLEDVDRILDGSVTFVAAVHGLIRRVSDGALTAFRPAAELDLARTALKALVRGQQGLFIEDKDISVALHYRQKPEAQEPVKEATARIALATGLVVQEGSMVSELRTAGPHKGDSLQVFMAEPPFAGRMPIAVGDDLTDENAFEAAAALGGYGVLVGPARETNARYRLDGVEATLAWLADGS